MIVATAGHVNHGKTTLVRLLTGVDTDRSAEEKRRGMTIDLGFAYRHSECCPCIGFVDVPGHERFIRNMLAGVAAVDLMLLVIAADDGPMPQTREHLAVAGLLGIQHCVVVLTKTDRVSQGRLEEAHRETALLLSQHERAHAPVFNVSSLTGTGLQELGCCLEDFSKGIKTRSHDGLFRFVVDRCFTVPGAGVVVTGAVISGQCRVGDSVVISPRGLEVRIRSIRSHDRPASAAAAGERCALNITGPGIERESAARGDWLLESAAHAPTMRLDAKVHLLEGASQALRDGASVHLHLGAAIVLCRVGVIAGRSVAPGHSAWVQLLVTRMVHAACGDRFVLRDPGSGVVLGGGPVVDPVGAVRGRSTPRRLAQLAGMQLADHAQSLLAVVDQAPEGIDLQDFARGRNLPERKVLQLAASADVHVTGDDCSRYAFAAHGWNNLRGGIVDALGRWHAEQPASIGPSEAQLAAIIGTSMKARGFASALKSLLLEERVVRDSRRLRLETHVPALDPERAKLQARLESLLRVAGPRPPIVGELARQMEMDLPVLIEFLQSASACGHFVRVAKNRWFLPERIGELLEIGRSLERDDPKASFCAAQFRDATSLGRNLTIEVLEFFDRSRLTRFDGHRRRVVAN